MMFVFTFILIAVLESAVKHDNLSSNDSLNSEEPAEEVSEE